MTTRKLHEDMGMSRGGRGMKEHYMVTWRSQGDMDEERIVGDMETSGETWVIFNIIFTASDTADGHFDR